MYSEKIESLMDAIVSEGIMDPDEVNVLRKAAEKEGEDPDEVLMIVKGRIRKNNQSNQNASPATQVTPPSPQPSSQKIGQMLKCPSCGAPYIGGSAVCPECGYAFSGVSATKSAEKLYNELRLADKEKLDYTLKADQVRAQRAQSQANKKGDILGLGSLVSSVTSIFDDHSPNMSAHVHQKKMSIIQDFPVPNTREDLLDFLSSIKAKADNDAPKDGYGGKEDFGYAYYLLYQNCLNKAKISFSNDPAFATFLCDEEAKSKGIGSFFGKFKDSFHGTF